MEFLNVLVQAFTLLRERPVLFLPRIVMTLLWGGVWILLFDAAFARPAQVNALLGLLAAGSVLIPAQIWVYSSYFIVVQQDREGRINLVKAFRDGLHRFPPAFATFVLLTVAFLLAVLPGLALLGLGVMRGSPLLQVAGGLVAGGMGLAVIVLGFFTPTAAVLHTGEPLRTRLRRAVSVSSDARRYVLAITALSFLLLFAVQYLQQTLQYLGLLAFLLGRVASGVVSVYLLLLNPELYLEAREG